MKFYVYTLSYKGDIFYVGKGTKRRMYIHEDRARKGIKSNNNSALYYKIIDIIEVGESIEYDKIFETDNEVDAYEFEYSTIDSIGIENLCNITKDFLKTSLSERVKIGLSKSSKWKEVLEYKKSKELKDYYREINTGSRNPRYGKKNTKEHMDSIKKSLIGIPKSKEHRKKISEAITGIERSSETKSKLSESLKKSEKFQNVVKSEDFRNKHKESTQKRHNESIIYIFDYNGLEIRHNGALKKMALEYEITFYHLRRLRYGQVEEYNGWRFIEMINNSFRTNLN